MNVCSECGEPTDQRNFCDFCTPEQKGNSKKRATKKRGKDNRPYKGRDRGKGSIKPTYEEDE